MDINLLKALSKKLGKGVVYKDNNYFYTDDGVTLLPLDINSLQISDEIQQQKILEKINELKNFLNETQFKFGEDYDKKETSEWVALKQKRQEARDFIRAHEKLFLGVTP